MCPKYENVRGPAPVTRSGSDQTCDCTVCQAAKVNLPPGSGSGPQELPQQLRSLLFPHSDPPLPTQAGSSSTKPDAIKLCSQCLTEIGRGKAHTCSKGTMRSNLAGIVKSKSLKSKAKITATTLKAVFSDQNISSQGGTATLPTGGKPIQVTLGRSQHTTQKSARWSHGDLKRLQAAMNLSDRNIK